MEFSWPCQVLGTCEAFTIAVNSRLYYTFLKCRIVHQNIPRAWRSDWHTILLLWLWGCARFGWWLWKSWSQGWVDTGESSMRIRLARNFKSSLGYTLLSTSCGRTTFQLWCHSVWWRNRLLTVVHISFFVLV